MPKDQELGEQQPEGHDGRETGKGTEGFVPIGCLSGGGSDQCT